MPSFVKFAHMPSNMKFAHLLQFVKFTHAVLKTKFAFNSKLNQLKAYERNLLLLGNSWSKKKFAPLPWDIKFALLCSNMKFALEGLEMKWTPLQSFVASLIQSLGFLSYLIQTLKSTLTHTLKQGTLREIRSPTSKHEVRSPTSIPKVCSWGLGDKVDWTWILSICSLTLFYSLYSNLQDKVWNNFAISQG